MQRAKVAELLAYCADLDKLTVDARNMSGLTATAASGVKVTSSLPDPHYFVKPDPVPHQIRIGIIVGSRIRSRVEVKSRIRNRIEVNRWIRVRINVTAITTITFPSSLRIKKAGVGNGARSYDSKKAWSLDSVPDP